MSVMIHGLFLPRPFRFRSRERKFHTGSESYTGSESCLKLPLRGTRSIPSFKLFAKTGNEHSILTFVHERTFQRAFRSPGSKSSMERKVPRHFRSQCGTFVPGSEKAWERKGPVPPLYCSNAVRRISVSLTGRCDVRSEQKLSCRIYRATLLRKCFARLDETVPFVCKNISKPTGVPKLRGYQV